MNHIEIIAEAGINHGGSFNTAMAMVRRAKDMGADTVKFQLVDPDFYKEGTELYKIFKETFLPISDHVKLKIYADKIGIKYLCTPSDIQMCKALVEIVGVDRVKIASDSAKDAKLVGYLEQIGMQYIISTGMMGSANEVIEWSKKLDSRYATIMHCVSKYPCPENEANISRILEIKENIDPLFGIGYSDHTQNLLSPLLAVGCGAQIIEKHFMLDKKCIDANVSFLPNDFERMVNLIRTSEILL